MRQRYVLPVEIEQIAPHLWWWTAPHPDWKPGADGQGWWQRDVSSYALVDGGDLVLFDPLVPAGEEERFWEALDRDVEQHGPPQILLTVFWHARSSREILERYEGAAVWAHEPSAAEVEQRVPVAHAFSEGDPLPGRVEPIAMYHMDEAAFWLPSHRALLVGDSILGYEEVRLCPESWLRDGEPPEGLRASANRALARRPEWLLLTHGKPRQSSEASL
jgi:glyoxylase-like metal-dependent hydrolase (beta-lactamase superfamily II)